MEQPSPELDNPERRLALVYAPAARRAALGWVWALDEQFSAMVAAAREPTLALLRLTWWRDALARLDEAPPPAQPILQGLAQTVLPLGISGSELSNLEEGWGILLEEDAGEAAWRRHAEARGALLFTIAGRVLGGTYPDIAAAGRGWVLAERAAVATEGGQRQALYRLAAGELRSAAGHRWPRALRALGVLTVLAAQDARAGAPAPRGSPRRIARALAMGITGR